MSKLSFRSKLLVAVVLLASVLAAAELAARFALPSVPGAADVPRNPFRFRGWPEYTAARAPAADSATLVLLTNSQGYAGELSAGRTYPVLLESLLNEHRLGGFRRWHVLNWAADGMTSIEQTVLAARLQQRNPTLVLAVTGYADYAGEHAERGFLYCRSDVPRLASRCGVARRLPARYWRRHGHVEDIVTVWMHDRVALLRYREYFWSWLEARFPGVHEVLYAPSVNYLPWALKAKAVTRPLRKPANTPRDPVLSYGSRSGEMLADYLATLKGVSGRVIVVAQPIRLGSSDDRAQWHAAFQADVARLAAQNDLPLWDTADALPRDGFMTSSHFNSDNHKRFAQLLFEKLAGADAL